MPAISIVTATDAKEQSRWDAEAYTPELLAINSALAKYPILGDIATVSHPSEITRIYTNDEGGVPFILAGNIKPILPNLRDVALIPKSVAAEIQANRLITGDILVTRTGANHGVACVYLEKTGAFYTSGEGLIVRCHADIDAAYLGTFLGCAEGAILCKRAAYGSGQPHIGPAYLRRIHVLRSPAIEKAVGDLIREAWSLEKSAAPLYRDAERQLLERLQWSKACKKPAELFFEDSLKALSSAARFDAEYHNPWNRRVQEHLKRYGALKIASFCQKPRRGIQPEFSETGTISVIDSKSVRPGSLEPSLDEKTSVEFWSSNKSEKARVEFGDVLLNSTGRGTLGRAACWLRQDRAIADNHIAILRPDISNCIPVYLALFLNSPPGLAQSEMLQTGSSGQLELYPIDVMRINVFIPRTASGAPDIKWQHQLANKVIAAGEAKLEAFKKLQRAKDMVGREIAKKMR